MNLLKLILILIFIIPGFGLAGGENFAIESPLCGVLTDSGYLYTESKLVFLVPTSAGSPTVRRYSVAAGSTVMPPIEVFVNWWICVSKGEIISEPKENNPDFYGLIKIEQLAVDQSNGERGQE